MKDLPDDPASWPHEVTNIQSLQYSTRTHPDYKGRQNGAGMRGKTGNGPARQHVDYFPHAPSTHK